MRFAKKSLIICAVVLINLFLIVQIAMIGGVFWLNSDNGQAYAQKTLSDALETSGYNIEFDRFAYRFPQGLAIPELKIYQGKILIASFSDIGVNIDIPDLLLRRLELSVQGESLEIHSLPVSEPSEPSKPQPFILPDLYFTSFALSSLHFETVKINTDNAEPLSFTPTILSEIDISDHSVAIDAALKMKNAPKWMPLETDLKASFDAQALTFKIEHLKIISQLYEFSTHATGTLLETDIPAFNGSGRLSMAAFTQNGLEDIEFDLSIPSIETPMAGALSLQSAYKSLPVALSLAYDLKENALSINKIKASAPAINIDGGLTLNLDNMRANGVLNAQVTSLAPYAEIIGSAPNAQADLSLNLSASEDVQNIKAKLQNLVFDQNTIKNITLSTSCDQLNNCLPNTFFATLREASIGNMGTLTKGTISLKNEDDLFTAKTDITGIYGQEFNIYGTSGFYLKNDFPDIKNIDIVLHHKESNIHLSGSANKDKIDITASSKRFEFKDITMDTYGLFLDFMLSGKINITGSPAVPLINTTIHLENFPQENIPRIALTLKGGYADQKAQINISGSGDGINNIDAAATIPLTLRLYPFTLNMPETTALSGAANFSIRSKALTQMFLPPEHDISGQISGEFLLGGTIKNPAPSGKINLKDGTYNYKEYGITLNNINVSSELSHDKITVQTLQATDDLTGTLTGNSVIYLASPQDSMARIKAKNLKLFNSPLISGAITADMKLAGQNLKGEIALGRFTITIPEQINTLIPQLSTSDKHANEKRPALKNKDTPIKLDISVSAENQIFVRGWGLDAEFGGELEISGNANKPQFNGSLSSIRGRYEEFGKRFALNQSSLRFQGSIPPSPYLDIIATNERDGFAASVKLHGEFQDPKLSLSSIPSLPEDEIMSHILFGKSMEKITPLQAIQLKNTLDRFSGKGGQGPDPLGTLRNLTGLDDIRVENDGEETSVGVGKYLTDKVYLEFEQSSGEDSGGAKIQIEVTPSIQVESEVGQDAKAGAGVLWRWNY